MSEQGWQDFLAAKGVDDWVVLHGGAMAVFRVRSLVEAARLAEAVAKVTGLEGSGVLLTVATASLTIRLTRDIWQLEPRHLELARAVSAVARAQGPAAEPAVAQEVQVAIAGSRMRLTSASGVPSSGTHRWLTIMRWTRLDTDRRSGCSRSTRPSRCGRRCTSTSLSRASR
jgi:hypothetical protein